MSYELFILLDKSVFKLVVSTLSLVSVISVLIVVFIKLDFESTMVGYNTS